MRGILRKGDELEKVLAEIFLLASLLLPQYFHETSCSDWKNWENDFLRDRLSFQKTFFQIFVQNMLTHGLGQGLHFLNLLLLSLPDLIE